MGAVPESGAAAGKAVERQAVRTHGAEAVDCLLQLLQVTCFTTPGKAGLVSASRRRCLSICSVDCSAWQVAGATAPCTHASFGVSMTSVFLHDSLTTVTLLLQGIGDCVPQVQVDQQEDVQDFQPPGSISAAERTVLLDQLPDHLSKAARHAADTANGSAVQVSIMFWSRVFTQPVWPFEHVS